MGGGEKKCFSSSRVAILTALVWHTCTHTTRTMLTYLSNEVFERPPGNPGVSNFMGLGQVGVEDIHTHTEVRLIEVIGYIPANL